MSAYPKEPPGKRILPADAYTGVASVFEKAGFREAARRVPARLIMHLRLNND